MNTDLTDEMAKLGLIDENGILSNKAKEYVYSEKKPNPKNLYNCKNCGNTIVTEDKDEGVTPSSIPCKSFGGCEKGRMWSFGYNVPPVLVASHEWFSNGGEALDIRKITEIRKSPFNAGVPTAEVKELSNGRKITVPTKQGTSGRTSLHKKFNPKKNKK